MPRLLSAIYPFQAPLSFFELTELLSIKRPQESNEAQLEPAWQLSAGKSLGCAAQRAPAFGDQKTSGTSLEMLQCTCSDPNRSCLRSFKCWQIITGFYVSLRRTIANAFWSVRATHKGHTASCCGCLNHGGMTQTIWDSIQEIASRRCSDAKANSCRRTPTEKAMAQYNDTTPRRFVDSKQVPNASEPNHRNPFDRDRRQN